MNTRDRIEQLEHILGDPDFGHFYSHKNRVKLAKELKMLKERCDIIADEIPDSDRAKPYRLGDRD